jgi:hypothetical protein
MAESTSINWAQNQPAPSHAIRMIGANFPQVKNLGIYVCRVISHSLGARAGALLWTSA